VLLSGNHEKVVEWRRRQSLRRTFDRRPEILARAELDPEERRLVGEWRREESRDSTPAALPGQERIDI
jgi:tRNA (guanine37-N1)-methyltransferase